MFLNLILVAIVVLVMGGGGIGHLTQPELFAGFIFAPLPVTLTIYATGILQILIAIGAVLPATRARAGLAFALLCLAYMPLHVWDLFREDPVIAPESAAMVRIAVQVLFIAVGWALWKRTRAVVSETKAA